MSRAFGVGVVAGIVGAAIACTPVERLEVLPDVEVIGVVTRYDDGTLEGTPLVAYDPANGLPLRRAASGRTWIVGYTRAQLDLDEHAELGADPLVAPATCERALPAPAWSAVWSEDGLAPSEDPPALTTAGQQVCRAFDDLALRVDSRCFTQRCVPKVLQRGGCSVRLEACELGSLDVVVGDDAEACQTAPFDGRPDCAPSVYRTDGDAPFEITTVSAYETAPPIVTSGLLLASDIHSGTLTDLLILGDEIVTALQPTSRRLRCDSNDPWPIVFFDRRSMEEVRRVERFVCVDVLAPDASPDTFLATFADPSGWRLGRFSAAGQLDVDVPIPVETENTIVADITVVGDTIVVLVTVRSAEGTSELHYFDTSTLQHVRRVDEPKQAHTMARLGDEIVLPRSRKFEVSWVNAATGTVGANIVLDQAPQLGEDLIGLHVDVDDERVYVVGRDTIYDIAPDRTTVTASLDFNSDAVLFNIGPFGEDILLFATDPSTDPRMVGAMIYDTSERRILPGFWPVGEGIVSRARLDADGDLWVALGSVGAFARIRALPNR